MLGSQDSTSAQFVPRFVVNKDAGKLEANWRSKQFGGTGGVKGDCSGVLGRIWIVFVFMFGVFATCIVFSQLLVVRIISW